jgi:CDP-glucose 4,6-dehydratase
MNNLKGKKILLSGVTGFVGGNLVSSLLDNGAEIFGIVRSHNPNCFLFYEGLHEKIRIFYGEITDKELWYNIITEQQIDIIYHLAAQVEVGVGLTNPYLTFETNVRGTYTMLEASRMAMKSGHNLIGIIVASSDKSYGEYPVHMMPYLEDYPLLPKYPYDTSKACADMICQSYAINEYKLPIVITRFSNIYGPGQMNFSAIVPDSIRSGMGISKFIPRSDGSMVRDFIFAEDVADLYMKIAIGFIDNPIALCGQIFNAGSNNPINMRTLISKVFNLLGNVKDLEEILLGMNGKVTSGEIFYQHMSFNKVFDFFNWSPKHSIEEGLIKSIDWYKLYFEKQFNSKNVK